MKNDKQKHVKDLHKRYLKLAEKSADFMMAHEFIFYVIRYSVKMAYDTAPRDALAKDIIDMAIDAGIEWHKEELKQKEKENV